MSLASKIFKKVCFASILMWSPLPLPSSLSTGTTFVTFKCGHIAACDHLLSHTDSPAPPHPDIFYLQLCCLSSYISFVQVHGALCQVWKCCLKLLSFLVCLLLQYAPRWCSADLPATPEQTHLPDLSCRSAVWDLAIIKLTFQANQIQMLTCHFINSWPRFKWFWLRILPKITREKNCCFFFLVL